MNFRDHLAPMRLAEQALELGGRQILRMSTVGRPRQPARFTKPAKVDGHAFCAIDAMWDVHGQPRIIEVNGSNAGLSSLGDPEGDRWRAEHQIEAALPRILNETRGAVLVAFAANTLIVGEITARAFMLYELVSKHRECQFGNSDLAPSSPFVVAVDSVEAIAAQVTKVDGRLCYRGYPVVSVGNVNLLAELVRKGVIERHGADYDVEYDIFHDGRIAPLIHDKREQQVVADGTGFVPIRHLDTMTVDEVVAGVQSLLREGLPAVIKPNATSGGAGIDFFGPGATDVEIRKTLDHQVQTVMNKYGPGAEKSMWPIRVAEFAQSTGYPVGDKHHLWDMRVACFIRPGEVEMMVCGLRLCPEPFVLGHYDRPSACSNTTGRVPSTARFRAPLAEANRPTDLMSAAGVDRKAFDQILNACAAWCEAAWHHCSAEERHDDHAGGPPGKTGGWFAA
ncbi:MAG: hypothetical protein KDC18_16320 [Alphaproteobacteria bacterium]|nr:hypothetical protein [Alphaproteobacteria bacterium]